MALDKQIIPLSLGIGIDTKTDPKQVIASKLLSLENTVLGTGGEFKKRYGYDYLNTASSGNALASFKNQLIALDGTNLKSFSEKQDQFNSAGKKTCVDISKSLLARRSGNYDYPNIAYLSGLYGLIHTKNIISIIDSVTGQYIIKDQTVAGGDQNQSFVFALGTKFIFVITTSTQIKYFYVDSTAPTVVSAVTTLQTDYTGVIDCKVVGTNIVFAYSDNSGQTSHFYLSSLLVKSATFKVNTAPESIGIFDDPSGNVWVGNSVLISGSPNIFQINYYILNPTITGTVLGLTTIETTTSGANEIIFCPNISGIYNGMNGEFYYYFIPAYPTSTAKDPYIKSATYSVVGSQITAPAVILKGACLYSKPFIYNGLTYMVGAFSSTLQSTFVLIDETGHVASKFSIGNATNLLFTVQLRSVVSLSSDEFTMAFAENDALNNFSGVTYNQRGVSQMNFNFNDPIVTTKLGENLEISGGIMSMFDGANTVEHGFTVYPENIGITLSNVTGLLSMGTYQWCVTYEWTDAQGQLHRSAPSVPLSATTTSNTSIAALQIPTLRLTDKENVLIVVYRTLVNQSTFYQVTFPPASGSPLLNDKNVDYVTFLDGFPDSSIVGNNQLYTNGGELENISIPATDVLWTYQNRVLGVYSENKTQIGYSKQVIPGVPVEFNDTFFINAPEFDGEITSGIQMDDKCIIFKNNTIYYMVGQGPSANGQGNDFTTPQIISTDCGCIDKKSVVLMPRGVMFKSSKGIYLLERSLQVIYIGDEVESYNDDTITSSQMMEGVNQIRFSLDSGIVLVYDYFYDQWATFTNIDAIDSTIFQNVYTYIKSTGEVFQETIGSYTDNGAFVPISFTTAWFSFAKLQGFERAYKMLVLGEYKSPHTLQIDFSVNFDPTIVQSVSIPVLSSMTPYQHRIFITNQKCESFQLTVTELQDPSYGEGLTVSSLAFEVGGKRGLFKLPAANSYG